MAGGSNLLTFPARAPVLRVVEQSPTGRHGYEAPADLRDRVEVTAGLTKTFATRIDGRIWAEFSTATNAIRCAEHLRGLIDLGALHRQPPPSPQAA